MVQSRCNLVLVTLVTLGGAGVLLGGVVAAQGQTTSLHDIPWYMEHNAARSATLNLCRSDHRFSRDVDCANAETAEDRLWGQRAAQGALPGQRQTRPGASPFSDLVSPSYWAANKLARLGALAGCNRPVPTVQPDVCAAARQGDAMAGAAGRRP